MKTLEVLNTLFWSKVIVDTAWACMRLIDCDHGFKQLLQIAYAYVEGTQAASTL